jgi:hypothetical protein
VKPDLQEFILRQLNGHRIMTIASNRPDGWPQATTVAYVNDGIVLYCFVARLGQKFANVARDPRVSVAIASDFSNPMKIAGLSLAGKAALVKNRDDFRRVHGLYVKRIPEYAAWPEPNPDFAPLLRIVPEIISVLDYSKGFGHSDLITVSESDLDGKVEKKRHDWFGFAR